MMEQSDDYDKEVVILELGAGYTLHDRVLRPAKVKVGKPI
jgi:molecular chaperone GrpE (heat shock protein)